MSTSTVYSAVGPDFGDTAPANYAFDSSGAVPGPSSAAGFSLSSLGSFLSGITGDVVGGFRMANAPNVLVPGTYASVAPLYGVPGSPSASIFSSAGGGSTMIFLLIAGVLAFLFLSRRN